MFGADVPLDKYDVGEFGHVVRIVSVPKGNHATTISVI
jgi:hypothetical protein